MLETSLFGKLPALGDFVSRGPDGDGVRRVDAWLAGGMLALQASSEHWLQPYLVSPVWQCVVPAGRLCEQACAGALMPSVDRVGRYFPLMVWRPLRAPVDGAAVVRELAGVAACMPAALHELLTPDALLDRLIQPNARHVAAPDGQRLLAGFHEDANLSLWWSLAGPLAPFRFVSHRGPADPELFVSLFDGR